jgi:hypothetical protein
VDPVAEEAHILPPQKEGLSQNEFRKLTFSSSVLEELSLCALNRSCPGSLLDLGATRIDVNFTERLMSNAVHLSPIAPERT